MGEIISWLGNASYGVAGLRVREANPVVFRPTDISGLQIWLDANNSDSVNATPFGLVESWHNLGDLSGNFDLSGNLGVRYGDYKVNGLEVVSFDPGAYMIGTYAMNFQDRSIFIVSRRRADISGGVFTWLTSDTADGMETGISQSGANFTYLVATHPGFSVELGFTTKTDTKGYAELATFVNSSTSTSDNYVGLNSTEQTLIVSNLAAYETASLQYFLGNYFGGSALANEYDLCEMIVYDSVLTEEQRAGVEEYLTSKWAIVDPPPPPFDPSSISGLQVWLDASNAGSITTSGSDVTGWSNLGSASAVFAPGSNICTYSNSIVDFNTGATLDAYFQLPYLSRTFFTVFECKSDLTSIAYPFVNLMDAQATDGRQIGVSYDSNAVTYNLTVCQSGTNCPIVGAFSNLPTGLNLVYGIVDSNNSSNNVGYLNNSSNLNTSTDLGNLFNQNPIPYLMGSANGSGPAFRMAEFLEYDSILSSSNITQVTTYLSDKWGLNL
jgi:hypothetical protein